MKNFGKGDMKGMEAKTRVQASVSESINEEIDIGHCGFQAVQLSGYVPMRQRTEGGGQRIVGPQGDGHRADQDSDLQGLS